LIEAGWIETDQIVVSSLSGVSGAGRSKQTLAYHYPELNESMSAYGVGGKHRHTPEIEQTLTDFADTPVSISFTPHLIPVTRGILTTASAKLNAERSSAEVIGLFANKYAGERFVAVNLDGTTPSTKQVLGSNRVRIGAAVDEHIGRVVVIAVEDNLLKGAAGQAVQNMNIMLGLAEDAGLPLAATWP
jgi:N-acetyl-gamma-glutamyl-phosphate reductase